MLAHRLPPSISQKDVVVNVIGPPPLLLSGSYDVRQLWLPLDSTFVVIRGNSPPSRKPLQIWSRSPGSTFVLKSNTKPSRYWDFLSLTRKRLEQENAQKIADSNIRLWKPTPLSSALYVYDPDNETYHLPFREERRIDHSTFEDISKAGYPSWDKRKGKPYTLYPVNRASFGRAVYQRLEQWLETHSQYRYYAHVTMIRFQRKSDYERVSELVEKEGLNCP